MNFWLRMGAGKKRHPMKLLLFSDLHCDVTAAEKLVEAARTVDVVIGAGDFGNSRRRLNVCLDILQAITCPAVLVPGNNESYEELVAACSGWKSAHVLHGDGVSLQGVPFYGIGGGIPVTPFGDWSFDFSEEEATKLLADCPAGGILVSHSPPHGFVDVASNKKHLGSRAVLAAIERVQPALVVCGHIHASAGQQAMIGSTTVINAGPMGIVRDL